MSEYWFYHCKTCKVDCDEDFNHGDEALLNLLDFHPEIEAFKKRLPRAIEIDVSIMGTNAVRHACFLEEHAGHEVVVMSEYRRYYTKDGNLHERDPK